MDLTPYLPWIIFIHIVAAFGFVLSHGVSAFVAFRVRAERRRPRQPAPGGHHGRGRDRAARAPLADGPQALLSAPRPAQVRPPGPCTWWHQRASVGDS